MTILVNDLIAQKDEEITRLKVENKRLAERIYCQRMSGGQRQEQLLDRAKRAETRVAELENAIRTGGAMLRGYRLALGAPDWSADLYEPAPSVPNDAQAQLYEAARIMMSEGRSAMSVAVGADTEAVLSLSYAGQDAQCSDKPRIDGIEDILRSLYLHDIGPVEALHRVQSLPPAETPVPGPSQMAAWLRKYEQDAVTFNAIQAEYLDDAATVFERLAMRTGSGAT